jgi:hypothetical protein
MLRHDPKMIGNGLAPPDLPAIPPGVLLWEQIRVDATTDRLVKGIIGEQCFGVVAGESGSGKTFAALDMALHIAAGWPWFGRKVQRCGVLYIGAEGQSGLKKRVAAWQMHHAQDQTAAIPFALFPRVVDLVNDAEGAAQVIDYIGHINIEFTRREWPAIGAVIIDTLAKCFGGGDENSARDMGAFTSRCSAIMDKGKATALAVHHHGKNAALGMRGSSALKAAADTVLAVTGLSGTRTLELEKSKDGEGGQQFHFDLRPIDLSNDEDGEPITSCVVIPSDAPPERQRKATASPQARMGLDTLREAINAGGKPAPTDNHIPSGAIVVDVELWRKFHYARNGADTKTATKCQSFNRAVKSLQASGAIGCWQGQVWVVQ